jgi:hypothetical protein
MEAQELQDLRQWKTQGLALRQKYEAERDRLRVRLKEIEEALQDLPSAEPTVEEAAISIPLPGKGGARTAMKPGSVPSVVLSVIRDAAGPISSSEIIRGVERRHPKIDVSHVYTAIRRLKLKGKLRSEGRPGESRYRIA